MSLGDYLIVLAGVPGTGKTILARYLSRQTQLDFTTLSWITLEHRAWSGYDSARRSFIVDPRKLCENIRREYSKGYIVETHWLGFLEECRLEPDTIIITRTHPLILHKRLVRRGWPKRKVVENVEAEFLGVIVQDVINSQYKTAIILEVDTSNADPEILSRKVHEAILSGRIPPEFSCCRDWLSLLAPEEQEILFNILSTTT